MLGIGIDITPVERIARLDSLYQDKFRAKVLCAGENPATVESLAGLWAAKEAVSKAMGTGIKGFGPTDICILRDSLGAPMVTLRGGALDVAKERGISRFMVSISHSGGLAVACAVAL